MLGGMRAVTWTQVAQYIILIIAYLIPVVWLSTKLFGNPIPELAYGQVLDQIAELEQKLGILKPHAAAYVDAKGQFSWVEFNNFWALTLTLMIGTASLPHILMRYFTTPNVKDARTSVGWSIFFIFLLYFTAPAYAAFAKLEVYTNVIGHEHRLAAGLGAELVAGRRPAHDQGRQRRRHPAVDRVHHQPGHHRPVDAGDRGPAVRDLRAWSPPAAWRRRCRPPTACCSPSPTRSATTSTTR